MPRPAYILLSQSGAFDQTTNAASFFNVVDVIPVKLISAEPSAQDAAIRRGPRNLRLVVCWLKEDSDLSDQEFEGETVCLTPAGDPFFESPLIRFRFTAPFHRLFNTDIVVPGFPALGTYELRARVRRVDQEEWASHQSFPFVVQEKTEGPGIDSEQASS